MATYTALGQSGEFLEYPAHKVVGIFKEWTEAQAAIAELSAAGFRPDQIGVLAGEKGAERLDASGERHGILAQISRFFQNFADLDAKHVARHEQELLAGHVLVAVDGTEEPRRDQIRQLMKSHGGYFINYYGKWWVENLDA